MTRGTRGSLTRLAAAATALALAAPAARVAAQAEPPSVRDIGPGCCSVRISAPAGTAQGVFRGGGSAGVLFLRPCRGALCPSAADSAVQVPPGARLEIRTGSHGAKGGFLGALIGAVGGAVLVVATNKGDDVTTGEAVLIGAPVGALVGAAAGAVVGSMRPRWGPLRP